MINLLIGGPGGGKSYEAVAFHILPALTRGRKVVTNMPLFVNEFEAVVPGCSSLIELREKSLAKPEAPAPDGFASYLDGLGITFPSGRRPATPKPSTRPFSHPDDFASDWRHPTEQYGPLYVVDECHFAMPRGRTHIGVEEWFSMHRHYNCDVLLMTQSSGKISAAIKDLVQVCYKVRKAVALGKNLSYIRKVLDGVGGGEVSVTERKYDPKYFKLYRSHTQGFALDEQSADDVSPLSVRLKRFSLAFYAVTAVVLVWAFWPKPGEQGLGFVPVVPAPASKSIVQPAPVWTPAAPVPAASAPVIPASAPDDLEPFKSQGVHITGWMSMGSKIIHTFVISAGGYRLFELREPDILKAGYTFQPLGECSGLLRFGPKVRTVICDAPTVASGRNDAPVFVALDDKGQRVSSRD